MANTLVLKRSAVASKVPTTADLALGELAVNTFDGKLYMKKDNGTASIIQIGAGGGASVTISDTAPSSPTAGDLWWESDTGVLKVYYNDGSSSQWVDAVPTYSSTGAAAGQWERLSSGEVVISSPTALVSYTLPSTYRAFRLTFVQLLAGTSGAVLYYRISTDNGSTYYSGASDYTYEGYWGDGGSNGTSNAAAAYGVIGGGYSSTLHAMGTLLLDPGSVAAKVHGVATTSGRSSSGSLASNTTASELTAAAGRATNIQIGMSSGNIANGIFVMEGLKA